MEEPSTENPKKTIYFQLTSSIKLKQSIESLNDSEFNPENIGRIDITEKGFEITVLNSETFAAGYLFFKSSGLINFHCTKPIISMLISLNQVSLIFSGSTTDDDTVIVSHVDSENSLTFIFGSAPNTEMKIDFLEEECICDKFPDVVLFCEAVMTSKILREIIQKLEETDISKLVSVDMTERLVFLLVDKNPWIFKYETEKVVGTRGLEPGQRHHAWFVMRHLEALKKATNLVPCLLMCFLTEPAGYIMMRFCLRELGDLVFINKATKLLSNVDDIRRMYGTGAEAVAMQPV